MENAANAQKDLEIYNLNISSIFENLKQKL
jgi:hypothetical protein